MDSFLMHSKLSKLRGGGWGGCRGLTSIKQTRELEPAGCILALQSVRVADVTATTHGWKHKRKITQSVYMSRSQSEQELDDTCERSKNTQCGTHINLHLLHTVYGHTAVTHLHIRQIFRKLSSFCLFTNSKNYGSSLLARWCVSASVWCALVV